MVLRRRLTGVVISAILALAGSATAQDFPSQDFPGSKPPAQRPQQPPQQAPQQPPASQAAGEQTPDAQEPAEPSAPILELNEYGFVFFETADGSRFLLVPDDDDAAMPVVHWAVVTPIGVQEDEPGREGLARAVARASLNGTIRYGSWDSGREASALRSLDSLERQADDYRRRGEDLPEDFVAGLQAARATAADLGDPQAWRRALQQCPADYEVSESNEAFLLQIATSAEALPKVALLLFDRRENARLRLVREEFQRVRDELREAQQGALATLHREIIGMAFLGSPAARPIDLVAGGWTRNDALATHKRIQQPGRSYHVLTGGFDVAEAQALMHAVFARSSIENVPSSTQPASAAGRHRSSTVFTEDLEAYALAVPVPPDTDARQLAVLGRVLAGGRWSAIGRALQRDGHPGFEVDFLVPFPPERRPGMFLIELRETQPAEQSAKMFSRLVSSELANASLRGLPAKDVERAIAQVTGRLDRARYSPARLVIDLANWCGVRGIDPAVALAPFEATDPDKLRKLGQALFLRAPRTEVRLERQR